LTKIITLSIKSKLDTKDVLVTSLIEKEAGLIHINLGTHNYVDENKASLMETGFIRRIPCTCICWQRL